MMTAHFGFAQNRLPVSEADSLFAIWQDTTNTAEQRINGLYNFYRGFRGRNPDSVLHYSEMHLKYAKRHNSNEKVGNAHFLRGDALYDYSDYRESKWEYYRAQNIFLENEDSASISFTYAYLGNIYKVALPVANVIIDVSGLYYFTTTIAQMSIVKNVV